MELLQAIRSEFPAGIRHHDHQVCQGVAEAALGLPSQKDSEFIQAAQDLDTSGGPARIPHTMSKYTSRDTANSRPESSVAVPHAAGATAPGVTGQLTSQSSWKQPHLGGTSSKRIHRPRGASAGSLSMPDGASTIPDLQAIEHHKHMSMSGFPLPVIPRPGSPLPSSPLAGRPPLKGPGSAPSGIPLPDRFLSGSPRPVRQPFAHGQPAAKGASRTEHNVAALRAEERGTQASQNCSHWPSAGASQSAAAPVIRSPNLPSTAPLSSDSRSGTIRIDGCDSARHASPWGTSTTTAGVSRECPCVRVAAAGSSPSGTDAGWRTNALSSYATSSGSRPAGSGHNSVALPMPPR